ncbi:MAG: hypothetical protein E6J53_10820, partial [Chloroflexi bacterium]
MEEKAHRHLIVGLGNPESEYGDTRHNMGFACVRELARRLGVSIDRKRWQSLVGHSEEKGVWLVMPQTYMNLSGEAVAKALKDTKLTPEQTWIVYAQRNQVGDERAGHRRIRPFSRRDRQACPQRIAIRAHLRARPLHQGGGGAAAQGGERRRRCPRAGARRRGRARHGSVQPAGRIGLRGVGVTLWQTIIAAEPKLERWLRDGGRLQVGRLPRSAWPIVAGSLARAALERGRPVLVLAAAPERFADELRLWLNGRPSTYAFAEITVSFLDRPPAFDESVSKRLEALDALARSADEPAVVVASRRAYTRQTISRHDLVEGAVLLAPGRGPDPMTVAGRLVDLGYSREAQVETHGQFSLRGGILDVFPSAADSPVRAEWSGDVIETLRLFDPENQRSVMAIPEVSIRTGRELLLGPARGSAAVSRLRESVSLGRLRGDVLSDWEDELTRLEAGAAFPGVEFYAAYLDPARPSLLDHLPEDAVILDFEPDRQRAEARTMLDETAMLAAAEAGGGELPRGFALPEVVLDRLDDFGSRPHLSLTAGEGAPDAVDLGWIEGEPLVGQKRAVPAFAARSETATVVLASEQGERLRALLEENHVPNQLTEVDLDLDLELRSALLHADLDIAAGTSQPGIGFHLATDAELFGRLRRPSRGRGARTKASDMTKEFTLDFAPDELVVHVDHGIARFKGMRLIESDGAHREYLELEYAEGDRLFIPVENLDRVQKFLGGEGAPALHRLGTSDWTRARGRARKVVQDVAEDLLRIYSLREARAGIAFAPDTAWQQELESSFPYEETPDQLAALAEIKADMESDRPMDRLLCGDVGFGK